MHNFLYPIESIEDDSVRDKYLNIHWFQTLAEARRLIEKWGIAYKESVLT
jgi:hypothetical protein